MVIQRFQTLFLLLATILVIVFMFTPFGYSVLYSSEGDTTFVQDWTSCDFIGLLIPSIIAAILYLVAIFLYKNMPLQKTMVVLAVIMTLVAIGVTIYLLAAGFLDITVGDTIYNTRWGGGGLLLVAALLAGFAAISRISADQRILRNVDRLR